MPQNNRSAGDLLLQGQGRGLSKRCVFDEAIGDEFRRDFVSCGEREEFVGAGVTS